MEGKKLSHRLLFFVLPVLFAFVGSATVALADITISASGTGAELPTPTDGQFTVEITHTVTGDTEISYSITGGTATPGSDYALSPTGSVTIPDGSSTAIIAVDVSDDDVIEATETVEVSLTGANNSQDAWVDSSVDIATVTISDDDSGDVSVTASVAGAAEGGSSGEFTFTLSDVSSQATTVNYSVTGTAASGTDYTDIGTSVVIPPGDTEVTVSVDAINDSTIEEDGETVIVSLSGVSGDDDITMGPSNTATVTIDDNDSGEVSVAATTATAYEGGSSGLFTFSLSDESSLATTITYSVTGTAASGTDYTDIGTSVVIPPGDTEVTVSVDTLPDTLIEKDETVIISLSGVSGDDDVSLGTPGSATVMIEDDDVATVGVTATISSAVEGGASGEFTFTLTDMSSQDTMVNYDITGTAVNGTDYSLIDSSVLIPAGATEVKVDIVPVDESIVEADESVIITISTLLGDADITVGATDSAVVTVIDNDSATVGVVATTLEAIEGGDSGLFTFSLTDESSQDTTINYDITGTALNGTDYTSIATSVVIPAGDTEATVTIDAIADSLVEAEENVVVTLTTLSGDSDIIVGAATNATVTLTNMDHPTITVNSSEVYEGQSGSTDAGFVATIDLAVANGVSVVFDWALDHGTTDNIDFSDTMPIGDTVTFTDSAAGATANLPVGISGDTDIEGDEEYSLILTNNSSTTAGVLATLTTPVSAKILEDEFTIIMEVVGTDGVISAEDIDGTTRSTASGDSGVVVGRNTTPIFNMLIDRADACYHIESVAVDGTEVTIVPELDNDSMTASYTFPAVTEDHTITLTIDIDHWTITSSIAGEEHGTITNSATFEGCSDATYSVVSDTDYHISYVDVDGTDVEGPNVAPFTTETFNYDFTDINQDHTITAAFTQRITVIEESEFGEISPAPTSEDFIEVAYGSDVTFTITALAHDDSTGYEAHTHHVSEILIDDVPEGLMGSGSVAESYTFTNVEADTSIEAQFTGYVDVTINGPGSVVFDGEDGNTNTLTGTETVTGTGSIEFDADLEQIFEIQEGAGYHIEKVLVDGVNVGAVAQYDFYEKIPTDHTMEVTFDINWYSIVPSSTYDTIYDDADENIIATTKYPTYGSDISFYVDLNDANHAIEAIFIDSVNIPIPTAGSTYTDPGGEFELSNDSDDTLTVTFTSVGATHRLTVLDYDVTPIADVPLVASSVTAPANIMFIIDDSGSMSWSVMVPGVEQGKFCSGGSGYYCSGGTRYTSILQNGDEIPDGDRMLWKSQWHGYNKMYYNPNVTYTPWPRVVDIATTMLADGETWVNVPNSADADVETPRWHPLIASVMDMSATFATVDDGAGVKIIVDNEDSDFSRSSGDWSEYNYSASYNNMYLYANGAGADKWARWTFTPPEDGDYDVYVSWHETNDRETVTYTVECNNCGTDGTEVDVDQSEDGDPGNGDPNHYIGTYTFVANETVTVTLDDDFQHKSSSSADAVMISTGVINIPYAHYYVWSETDSTPYLVTFDELSSTIRYFKASGTGLSSSLEVVDSDQEVTGLEEVTDLTALPDDVRVENDDYATAVQNFANWVTYYRERRCAALAAVARSIVAMEDVQVGLSPLWTDSVNDVVQLTAVDVDGVDGTDDLLAALYAWPTSGGTPLKDALEEVGEYFEDSDDDNDDWSQGLDAPWASEDEGGACQQSFAILMTDGYYNSGGYEPNNNDNDGTDGADPADFTDADGDTLYASSDNSTLADIAMRFYETDLAPGLTNSVATSPDETTTKNDPATWQHLVTYTVSFGLNGTLDPDDYNLDVTSDTPNYPDWPTPANNLPSTIDDLWHAAVNSRGLFLNADDPDELVTSLLAIIENISKRTGSGASVAINGDELYETIDEETRVYQSSYNTTHWYGDLEAYKLVVTTADEAFDADDNGIYDSADWSASEAMQARTSARNIFTYNTEEEAGKVYTSSNLSDIQLMSLTPYYLYGVRSAVDVADYLGGDTTYELVDEDEFRERVEPLGDFVNSKAVYEDGTLYIGGNDGMLHAFDVTNGDERFAYIPGLVYQDLRELANPEYSHKYFVDGTPYVKEISDSLTLLIGGLGKGGKGYYMLDVTNPESFSANDVLWEYPSPPAVLIDSQTGITFENASSDTDRIVDDNSAGRFSDTAFDAGNYITVIGADCDNYSNNGTYEIISKISDDEIEISDGSLTDTCGDGNSITITASTSDTGMGYTFSTPIIVQSNDDNIGSGHLAGYVAIVGNGYSSEDGTAQLYILDPSDGSVITKFDTGVGPGNGLSSPTVVDVDNDLKADYVYAGDLLGNMWKFDLTAGRGDQTDFDNEDRCSNLSKCYQDWEIAFFDGTDPMPLFTGMNNQPITAAPDVMNHPSYNGYIVVFGTGRFLGMLDLETTYIQSLYGIWDWAPDNYDLGYLGTRGGALEDIDGDGRLDEDEDLDGDGVLDVGEDIDGDGVLDVDEDVNGNGLIDETAAVTLSNSPNVDSDGDPLNTLLRQEILTWTDDGGDLMYGESLITEDADGDGVLSDEEDVDGDGVIDTYSYYRIITQNEPDWSVDSTIDVNGDGTIDTKDKVPQNNLGYYFDFPGKLMEVDSIDNDGDGSIDEDGERALGERVTSDMIIRDGKSISISYMVTGSVCDVGMYSFLNERDAETGGRYTDVIFDINGDGVVDEDDLVMVYEGGDLTDGPPSDQGIDGMAFVPAILQTSDKDDGTEVKIMSTSTGTIETVTEAAEERGVYYWQQIE